ncbi:MAG: DUF4287 domain-containing protein [Cypionkella sp.]|uniref:DUF4287 domain-containing protein n=1 Tax=Cypionkella sp. TaxID=2811411 RepID=UPI002AB9A1A9|nr:DUF4287 domain-containing protein [Cypionkella sp.]MDZ4310437.1 DUF4287 domain-containing protein [Cypionkella sp.]MDZ4393994.1 DUF4287 domain-containing protein [Cypionkella sp.]
MSFQAYLDNIQAKTGKSPADFKALAQAKGFATEGGIAAGVKATQITDWLKAEFDLGHGHAMAIFALLKGKTS